MFVKIDTRLSMKSSLKAFLKGITTEGVNVVKNSPERTYWYSTLRVGSWLCQNLKEYDENELLGQTLLLITSKWKNSQISEMIFH
jgi:hypothetical protein